MLLRGIQGKTVGVLMVAMASGSALGQVGVETDPAGGKIFQARNSGTTTADGIALFGENRPAPFYGIGVSGSGGYRGVAGYATMVGPGSRYGAYFSASGGTTTNYGVYSTASGGASSYAGYFSGNVLVSGTFTNPSDERLKRNIAALDRPLAKVMALRPAGRPRRTDEPH